MSTIRDVARRAGVGVGTVSRYLNGSPVKQRTRDLIESAIEELSFVANRTARGLATGRVPMIGVLVPFVTSPSALERVRGIIERARPTGLPVSILDVEHPQHVDEHIRSLSHDLRPEELIVVSLRLTEEQVATLEGAGIHPVFLDVDQASHPSLIIDDVEGGRIATRHLVELGHERIAFVGDVERSDLAFTSSALRRRGYDEVLAADGIATRAEYTVLRPHGADDAAAALHTLMRLPQPPTAVFAASDTQALGILRAARELGLRVPEDLSIVGFDDIESAHWSGLTTVRQPLRDLSMEAVDIAVGHDETRPLRRIGELTLVARGTTSAPPRPAHG